MEILEFISVMALSAFKMVPGYALAKGGYDMTVFETFLSVGLGGMIGISIYTYFGAKIRTYFQNRSKARSNQKPLDRKKIKRLRRMIKIWRRFGIWGIAFLTPPILSPPFGTAISLAFGEKSYRIIIFLGISTLLWAFAFAFFGDLITQSIPFLNSPN
ncbi:MAG: hypothetical protein H6581_09140 [Bacteroidia bacterium]|nr:hypothetical protein [Bacteroidia bacterium]